MKWAIGIIAVCLAGCGIGSCPPVEDLEDWPVPGGIYELSPTSVGDGDIFGHGEEHQLVVDQTAGTAALTFVTAEGRQIEITYRETDRSFEF